MFGCLFSLTRQIIQTTRNIQTFEILVFKYVKSTNVPVFIPSNKISRQPKNNKKCAAHTPGGKQSNMRSYVCMDRAKM